MTFAEAAMIMMGNSGGVSGKVKPISITKNGDYALSDDDKEAGYIGYTPAHVNVTDFDKQSVTFTKNGSYRIDSPIKYAWNPIIVNVDTNPVINSLSVSEPGTYHAYSYSCNGFDPVIVSDKYKKLYEQAKGNGETLTDEYGNEIDNAIEISSDDLSEYTEALTLTKYGGAVTLYPIGDGDVAISIQPMVIGPPLNDTSVPPINSVMARIRYEMTCLSNSKTYHWYLGRTASIQYDLKSFDDPLTVWSEIDNITISDDGGLITVEYSYYKDNVFYKKHSDTLKASLVNGGTKFAGSDSTIAFTIQNYDGIYRFPTEYDY